ATATQPISPQRFANATASRPANSISGWYLAAAGIGIAALTIPFLLPAGSSWKAAARSGRPCPWSPHEPHRVGPLIFAHDGNAGAAVLRCTCQHRRLPASLRRAATRIRRTPRNRATHTRRVHVLLCG